MKQTNIPMKQASGTAGKARRTALYMALMLALILLGLDRSAAWLHRPAADSTGIVIYTTTWCGYCAALRGRGVPVSVIGPDIVHGFDLDSINSALAGLGHPVSPAVPTAAGGDR
jgi:hypothetical protein